MGSPPLSGQSQAFTSEAAGRSVVLQAGHIGLARSGSGLVAPSVLA
jgi:hypothetical protein